ncbi:hypothetical protein DN051_16550 [Streptomyces cadmiisoli]|uniref:Uncharacterized protein n=1 Tax=Streptomyces cadmiisoli TaxID=2184053 RepID=A0A2Z4IYV9_9ACTN|nr:hypothetical protein DN051_16550 [Streptomyces cadmiisoli]
MPPLAAPGESPSTSGTRASARPAESTHRTPRGRPSGNDSNLTTGPSAPPVARSWAPGRPRAVGSDRGVRADCGPRGVRGRSRGSSCPRRRRDAAVRAAARPVPAACFGEDAASLRCGVPRGQVGRAEGEGAGDEFRRTCS